jgi:uncharacterized protein (TIGR03083 family)
MPARPEPLSPIFTAHLFPELERRLLELLRSLTPDEWSRRTVAPRWSVKDVAAHLLDTQLRRLSWCRDGHSTIGAAPETSEDVVRLVNDTNARGVAFFGRLSPPVLIALMEVASRENAAYLQSLAPFSPAPFPVSWAGEDRSASWFDVARELTERWHHQQQIRLATDRPGIMTPELYGPVLECFMRGVPHAYRTVTAPVGTMAQFDIVGHCGGRWYLYRSAEGWMLSARPAGETVSRTTLPQEIAWRVFTKGIDAAQAREHTSVDGDETIGLHILRTIAIVA